MDKLKVGDVVKLEFAGRSESSTSYRDVTVTKVTPTGRVTVQLQYDGSLAPTDYVFHPDGRVVGTTSRKSWQDKVRLVPAAEWPRIVARRQAHAREVALNRRLSDLVERFKEVRNVHWATQIVSVRNELNELIEDMAAEGFVPEHSCALPPGHDGRQDYGC